MHLRQVLTTPSFLNALNKANSQEARVNELKRLKAHAKNLAHNVNALPESEKFDLDFDPFRVFIDSQYVISCLNELVDRIKQSDKLTDGNIADMIRSLFNIRNAEALKIRNDYCPGLPKDIETDAHNLLWKLAELCAKHWDEDTIKILIPTLEVKKLHEQTISKEHKIILNEARTYPISITTFLNRLAKGEGLTYFDPYAKITVALTKKEKIRLAYALAQYSNPNNLRISQAGNDVVNFSLSKLRKECVELLKNDNEIHHDYYDLDKEHYYNILSKPWIIKNPKKLFEFMGYLPSSDWQEYVDAIFAKHTLEEINQYILNGRPFQQAVQESEYYTKDRNHNAAVLFFFTEMYSRNRDTKPEFESALLNIFSRVLPQSFVEYFAYSKSNKNPAIEMLQSYLVSKEELDFDIMRAYFIHNKQEIFLRALCEPNSKSEAIVGKIKSLGQPGLGSVAKLNLFNENKRPQEPNIANTATVTATPKVSPKMG